MKYYFDLNMGFVLRPADSSASGEDVFDDTLNQINSSDLYFSDNSGMIVGYKYKIISGAVVSAPTQKYIWNCDVNDLVYSYAGQNYWTDTQSDDQLWTDTMVWPDWTTELVDNHGMKKYRKLTASTYEERSQAERDAEYYAASALAKYNQEMENWNRINYERDVIRGFINQIRLDNPDLTIRFIDYFASNENLDLQESSNIYYDSINDSVRAETFGQAVNWKTKSLNITMTKCSVIFLGNFIEYGYIPSVEISNDGGTTWLACTFSESATYSDKMMFVSSSTGVFKLRVSSNPPGDLSNSGFPYGVGFALIFA